MTLVQIDTDTLPDVAPNTLALFGTMTDSGFAVRPVKGDSIQYQGATYQVFEMKQDNAGGTPETAGLHIYLK